MAETWSLLNDARTLTGQEGADHLSSEVDEGRLTTYLASDMGRVLAFVSNGSRAMVVLMSGEGDPGEHAVTPDAVGSSDGYVLETGQEDAYDDADTVPLPDALDVVRSIVDSGRPPAGMAWSVDR